MIRAPTAKAIGHRASGDHFANTAVDTLAVIAVLERPDTLAETRTFENVETVDAVLTVALVAAEVVPPPPPLTGVVGMTPPPVLPPPTTVTGLPASGPPTAPPAAMAWSWRASTTIDVESPRRPGSRSRRRGRGRPCPSSPAGSSRTPGGRPGSCRDLRGRRAAVGPEVGLDRPGDGSADRVVLVEVVLLLRVGGVGVRRRLARRGRGRRVTSAAAVALRIGRRGRRVGVGAVAVVVVVVVIVVAVVTVAVVTIRRRGVRSLVDHAIAVRILIHRDRLPLGAGGHRVGSPGVGLRNRAVLVLERRRAVAVNGDVRGRRVTVRERLGQRVGALAGVGRVDVRDRADVPRVVRRVGRR